MYSFGVVLLELMTGRPAVSREGEALAHWAGEHIQTDVKKGEGIVDPQLEVRGPGGVKRSYLGSRVLKGEDARQ